MPRLPAEIRTVTRAAPVGACIYCGATDNLSDEHVVPFALGGNLVLPDASCPRCAKITSRFERRVLRGFMLEARTTGKFPTRRPRHRPIMVKVKVKRGGRLEEIVVPANEATGFMLLVRFDRATFVSGRPPMHGLSLSGVETVGFGRNLKEYADSLGTKTIQGSVTIDAISFARIIAKIGYGFAVAECGEFPRNECPVLPFILGTADDGGTWIGSVPHVREAGEQANFRLLLTELSGVIEGVEEKITVALVKLFASSGTTGYEVVVRRRSASPHA